MTELHMIVAHARNGVIGKEGKLPWYLPEDLRYFKRTTLGKPVIMGRKTWETLGRPLPGRRNIVVTRQKDYVAEGADVVGSIEAALSLVADAPVAFIMGGAQIYKESLIEEESFPATDAHPFSYSFRTYRRK